jgi:hypothetical protein
VREFLYFIASLSGAAVLTAMAVIIPPESALWRAVLYIGIVVLVTTSIAIFIDMIVPVATMQRKAKFTAVGFLAIAMTVWGGWFYANYPASYKIMQTWFPALTIPSKPPSSVPPAPRNITSTFSKAYYNCKKKEGELDSAAIEKRSAAFKSFIEPYAEAYDFKPPTIAVVPGGDKVELVPLRNPPVNVPTKQVFQIVRVGKELTGVYSAQYLISVYGDYPLIPNSGVEARIRKIVAGLANVEPGDCELQ